MLRKTPSQLNGSPKIGTISARGEVKSVDRTNGKEADRRKSMDGIKSQSYQPATSLDGMPDDILREITSYCEESLRALRLVSSRVCLFVNDYVKQNVPQIDQVNDKLNMNISLKIMKTHSIYYQRPLRHFKWNDLILHHYHHRPNHTDQLPDLSGLKFRDVHINHPESQKDSSKVKEMLKMWNFENHYVDYAQLTNLNSDFITSILDKKEIKHLSITAEMCHLQGPRAFFLRLADTVESIRLEHLSNWRRACEMEHLFGVENHAWAEVVKEMFARTRLNKTVKKHCKHLFGLDKKKEPNNSSQQKRNNQTAPTSSGSQPIVIV
ncbi:hypothetical protein PRIPAC_74006 [Pristionchus pacificus]|uniref:Uncharacterized protein n=1 Tax=Pristionchus pacificus TaxID=54126 RepID=A0A2A6C1S6_PRIPA|nr:hypothetical protein PRIPAC_74006 [Pristionchus pacificus]|eukprot:PDM72086.1 hypothetical protein PRIPAC_38493 [Pristionchus pacificus]